MSSAAPLPSWIRLLVVALALLALVRGLGLVLHRPLLALANNYDQIRYTACLELAPWWPGVPAVAAVALFGDGDVEYAKHAQLAINYALASMCIPLAAIVSRCLRAGASV